LIVNADDFGMSSGINRGIIEAHERGIVTSASLMVRGGAAREAALLAREHTRLSVGLHVDLGEWCYRGGNWVPVYEVVDLENRAAVAAEIARQLSAFRDMLSCDPTHLDSHQHVHQQQPVRSLLVKLARELKVPLRHCSDEVSYCGDFYGQTGKGEPQHEAITMEGLKATLAELPMGVTELGCHPGWAEDLQSSYGIERAMEVQTLCDPGVRAFLAAEGIELHSFATLRGGRTSE
jgi:predicted glycoside hydrolase/deacetylase ChbG (UPF0249 family)